MNKFLKLLKILFFLKDKQNSNKKTKVKIAVAFR